MSENHRISTGCQPLDSLLGGGVERGTVTQVYGPPASGKTNIALNTAIETAVNDGTAVYIDSEGVSIDRFEQLLAGYDGDTDSLSSRIIFKEIHDFDEQQQAIQDIEDLAEEADLIVLDSATGFYRIRRSEDETEGDALRKIAQQITFLLSLARKHDLAVLITNQVYTDPDSDRPRPLGGHTLQHWTGTVIRLDRFRGGNRRATLEKHRSQPAGEAIQFQILESGIKGESQS
ncbi:MAG: DNA repair and recombination protein RadB [Halobacteriaceae archaeon]